MQCVAHGRMTDEGGQGELTRYNVCVYTQTMVVELKLRKVGNSVGLVLPKEVLTHLNVAEGDSLCVTSSADGSLRLSATNPTVVKQLEVASSVIRRYRNTLRELAK